MIRSRLLPAILSILVFLPVVSQQVRDPLNPDAPPPAPAPAEEQYADLTEARAKVGSGDLEGAEAILAPMLERFPDDAALLLMAGEVRNALGRQDQALPVLLHAAEVAPERPRVQFQLGSALAAAGRNEEAQAAFGAELENNDNQDIQVMCLLNRSFLLQKLKRYDEAAAQLVRAVELDPTKLQALGDAAALYIQAGRPDQAETTLRAAEENGFSSAQHQYSLGAAFYRKKMYARAVSAYRRCLELQPSYANAERGLGLALEKGGQVQEAAVHFRKYLELKPDARDRDRILEAIGGS